MCNFYHLSVRFEALDLLAELSQAIDTILKLLELPIKTVFREANLARCLKRLSQSFQSVLGILCFCSRISYVINDCSHVFAICDIPKRVEHREVVRPCF